MFVVFGIITHFNFRHSSRYVTVVSIFSCMLPTVITWCRVHFLWVLTIPLSSFKKCPGPLPIFLLTLFPFHYWLVAVVRYMYYTGFLPLCDMLFYFTTSLYFNKNENNMLTLMKIQFTFFSRIAFCVLCISFFSKHITRLFSVY